MSDTKKHDKVKQARRVEGKLLSCAVCGAVGGKYQVYVPSSGEYESMSITLRKQGDVYYCQDCFNPGGSGGEDE